MSRSAALFTSDPTLVRCELERLLPRVLLDDQAAVLGVGAYQDEVVLHRRYGVGVPRGEGWDLPDTDTVVLHAGALPPGQPLEDNAQPFRFRSWLFTHVGEVEREDRVRERLLDELPDFLQKTVRGSTLAEVVFGVFLSELRALGRTEDPELEAPLVGTLLEHTARTVEQAAAEVGGSRRPGIALVASNGRLLVGARRGGQPLATTLLEGAPTCARCGLLGVKGEPEGLVRDHLRRRTFVIASHHARPDGWLEVPDGGSAWVDRRLAVGRSAP